MKPQTCSKRLYGLASSDYLMQYASCIKSGFHLFYTNPVWNDSAFAGLPYPSLHHPSMMDATQGTTLIARQMAQLLLQLPEFAYTKPLPLLHNSTIGQHFRHILEFYACLIDGYFGGYVSYAKRLREAEPGLSPTAAHTRLQYLLKALESVELGKALQVESEFSDEPDGSDTPPAYSSSMGRELQYAFDHAIHHLAIIRLGLEQYFPDIKIPPNLGVAPSTLKHIQKSNPNPNKPDLPETNYG